ncbi:MAG: hypothetical protein J0L58_18695 [Burkholderiales bacterium]|nr:hypothetical protein [Burkholderiales bacterium]
MFGRGDEKSEQAALLGMPKTSIKFQVMSDTKSKTSGTEAAALQTLAVANHCVLFVDLLGQRVALRGQGLVPDFKNDEQRRQFESDLRASIGAIVKLQEAAADFLLGYERRGEHSLLRAQLSAEDQQRWDALGAHPEVKQQRWSDGLVYFASLGSDTPPNKMISVTRMLMLAGFLCLYGLARKHPVRGGLEVAWAAELHSNEIYGAAVARAYELESEVAGYPRIVVGTELLRFIDLNGGVSSAELESEQAKVLATLCADMLLEDADGQVFVHFLGTAFANVVGVESHTQLAFRAKTFVDEQAERFRNSRSDTKLAFRYHHLANYFSHWEQGAFKAE